MKTDVAIKLAASSLVLGVTMVGCKPAAHDYRPASASAQAVTAEQGAAVLFAQAETNLRERRFDLALTAIEQAVELSPRDVGYRMLLADLYLKNGRFRAAETSFADVVLLDPANQRAALSLALSRIAIGKTAEATAQLEQLSQSAAASDVGLAFALAGQPRRAIEMLEPAAREPNADARVRQNLALAYALAGDWAKARVTASQDVSPADLDGRMEHWAALAQPRSSTDQVAGLLGVTPVADAGQPVRLALAPAVAPVAQVMLAEAASAPIVLPASTAVDAPLEAAPQPVPTEETRLADAAQSLVEPVARVAKPLPINAATFTPDDDEPRISGRSERAFEQKVVRRKSGRFVVQIGAFTSPQAVERAWASASKRYPFAVDREPLSTTVTLQGRTFHRLSVAGFGTHLEASKLCGSIRSKGGACFVRTTAGDAPVQWASRYNRRG